MVKKETTSIQRQNPKIPLPLVQKLNGDRVENCTYVKISRESQIF